MTRPIFIAQKIDNTPDYAGLCGEVTARVGDDLHARPETANVFELSGNPDGRKPEA